LTIVALYNYNKKNLSAQEFFEKFLTSNWADALATCCVYILAEGQPPVFIIWLREQGTPDD
jgi:hypothetical protein